VTCNHEAASVEAVAEQWAGKASFVGVAWSGQASDYEAFVERHELTFPQVDDSAGDIFARFDLVSQPAVVIVDAGGEVHTLRGRADGETIAAQLDAVAS
jgi:hypothetical protein